ASSPLFLAARGRRCPFFRFPEKGNGAPGGRKGLARPLRAALRSAARAPCEGALRPLAIGDAAPSGRSIHQVHAIGVNPARRALSARRPAFWLTARHDGTAGLETDHCTICKIGIKSRSPACPEPCLTTIRSPPRRRKLRRGGRGLRGWHRPAARRGQRNRARRFRSWAPEVRPGGTRAR